MAPKGSKAGQGPPLNQYKVTMMELRQLMELRGAEGLEKVKELGGVETLCKSLCSDAVTGRLQNFLII